ncbi:MAG: hypothetical protein KKG99_09845 [Bacteroidetes bacterium]|nr:hypothetical protein [Bacteroidota bacterium]
MADAIKHRGPDGESFANFPWGSLGFRWLDIFGPETNPQPAVNNKKNISILFNGEIYNFNELVPLIQPKKIVDEANLILELYLIFGEKVFEKLKGMFAIAILSPEKLILARDSFGIKPLVYFQKGSEIYFASEIKALLRVHENAIEINKDSLAETAVFGFIFNLGETMFKGIKQVLPGSYIVFEDGLSKTVKYNNNPNSFYNPNSVIDKKTISHFSELMNSTAKLHLSHSKHDHALYLSGGLDSSLMAYYLQNNSSNNIHSYTLFDDLNNEDRLFANKVASEIGTIHTEIETGFDETLNLLKHYLYHYESLVTNGLYDVLGSVAFHILSAKIAKKHKVAYCGEGADELFGGYYWLHAHPLGVGDRLRAKSFKVNNGSTQIHDYIMQHFPDDDTKKLEMQKEIFDFLNGPGLTNCHLWSVDRSSSAFSFEARPFYLYNDIAEWALTFSINNKVTESKETKLIMKQYASSRLSPLFQDISKRKKIAMSAALNNSLRMLIEHSTRRFQSSNKKDLPHYDFSTYLNTDLDKFMFDNFYKMFVINRGDFSID